MSLTFPRRNVSLTCKIFETSRIPSKNLMILTKIIDIVLPSTRFFISTNALSTASLRFDQKLSTTTSPSLTSLQHKNFVYVNYLNFPTISVFSNTKIHLSYKFGTLNYSSPQIFKFLWLGYFIDEHKSYRVKIVCLTLPAKCYHKF